MGHFSSPAIVVANLEVKHDIVENVSLTSPLAQQFQCSKVLKLVQERVGMLIWNLTSMSEMIGRGRVNKPGNFHSETMKSK